jgi:hypothetical protein
LAQRPAPASGHFRALRAGLLLADANAQEEQFMTRLIFIGALLGGLGFSGACGASDPADSNPAETTDPTCIDPTGPNCSIVVNDRSFVTWTGPATDGVEHGPSTAIVEHMPGKFCMSGTVDAGPNGTGWGAFLVLGLTPGTPMNGRTIVPFDAAARGITQIRFTVDSPPSTGVLPQITELESAGCTIAPDCYSTFDRSAAVVEPGPVTMALADDLIPDANHPNTTLDPTLLSGLHFSVEPAPGMPLEYRFCIRDLAFLDASGREILP